MQTVVELPEFLRKSEKLLSHSVRVSIVNYLAARILQRAISCRVQAVSVNYGGQHEVKVKVVEYVLSATTTTSPYRYFF